MDHGFVEAKADKLVGSKLYYQMNILTKWLGIDILILFISYLLTTLNNKNKINSNF